jgi:hypothetical protein
MSGFEQWTCVERSGDRIWREAGGVERVIIPAVAYPLGAEARTCEAVARMCFLYADVQVDVGTASVAAKSQAWDRAGGGIRLAWFDARAPQFSVGDTIGISW